MQNTKFDQTSAKDKKPRKEEHQVEQFLEPIPKVKDLTDRIRNNEKIDSKDLIKHVFADVAFNAVTGSSMLKSNSFIKQYRRKSITK